MAASNEIELETTETEITPAMEVEAEGLVLVALANREAFEATLKYVPLPIQELALEKLERVLISRMLADVAVQMIPKDDRPEGSPDFVPLETEFLTCAMRMQKISTTIFPTRIVNSSGQGEGQKAKRVIKFNMGDEAVSISFSKSVAGKKEGVVQPETSEEVIVDVESE